VILGLFSVVEYERHRHAVLVNLAVLAAQTNDVIENTLQRDMLLRNLDGIQRTIDTLANVNNIRTVYLLDAEGRVGFAPEGADRGLQLDNHDPACQTCHAQVAEDRPASVVVALADGTRVFRTMSPIRNQPECYGCHTAEPQLLGMILTDVAMGPLENALAVDLRERLIWQIAIVLATVVVVNLVLSRLVLGQLERVARALQQFGFGRLQLRLPPGGPDEIGQLSRAFNAMAEQIEGKEAENEELSAGLRRRTAEQRELLQRLITAQEDERRRVARELHDELGQSLAGLAVYLQAVERICEEQPAQAHGHIAQMREQLADAADRTYDMILTLRPPALDDLGLVPALQAHADRVLERTGVRFELDATGLRRRLPPEVETALFRTCQEALSNVVRHSGARRVRLAVAAPNGYLDAEVRDDGRGFDPEAVRADGTSGRGLGLLGMQERITQCGGTLAIESRPGAGTRLVIRLPLPEGPEAG
jgi:signal transduction histidine kinase